MSTNCVVCLEMLDNPRPPADQFHGRRLDAQSRVHGRRR